MRPESYPTVKVVLHPVHVPHMYSNNQCITSHSSAITYYLFLMRQVCINEWFVGKLLSICTAITTTVEPLLSGRSGTYYCPYLRNVRN